MALVLVVVARRDCPRKRYWQIVMVEMATVVAVAMEVVSVVATDRSGGCDDKGNWWEGGGACVCG